MLNSIQAIIQSKSAVPPLSTRAFYNGSSQPSKMDMVSNRFLKNFPWRNMLWAIVFVAMVEPSGVQAQTESPSFHPPSSSPTQLSQNLTIAFTPPSDDRLSTSRAGGTRRSGTAITCIAQQQSTLPHLTALLPDNHLGLTTRANPTLFAYIPPTPAQQIYWTLQDESGVMVHEAVIPMIGTDVMVGFTLPEFAALKSGETYDWSLGLIRPAEQVDIPRTEGRIQQVSLDSPVPKFLELSGSLAASLERAVHDSNAGIW
jgi:hypothetical protein